MVQFRVSAERLGTSRTDVIVIPVLKEELFSHPILKRVDRSLKGHLFGTLKQEKFKGNLGDAKVVETHGALKTRHVLVVSLGEKKNYLGHHLRLAGGKATRFAVQYQWRQLCWALTSKPGEEAQDLQAIAEGTLLAQYQFVQYKKPKDPSPVTGVIFMEVSKGVRSQEALERGQVIAQATNLSRDLVNTPARDMTPRKLGEAARRALRGGRVRLRGRREIERMKMGAYLAVSQGSAEPPVLIHMQYRPRGKSRGTIVLVGKGVTFDSGGLSLKPPNSMETMKDDMAGAATMIGTMQAVMKLKPMVTVHALVAATENMPSGTATRPGDVVRAMNGKTIEILNTDAEGRLTLADALTLAQKLRPDVMIDAATLTGACLIALGEKCTGLMGNREALITALRSSAQACGEKLWPLPLVEEYKEELKSTIADVKNVGGRWGGTINAGLFLQEFVDPKIPWAHLDIAGPSWVDQESVLCPRGGTGCLVSTLTHFVLNFRPLKDPTPARQP